MASLTERDMVGKVKEGLTCRKVLNIMVFFGFMVNYMLRVNLTIAIVDMVVPASKVVLSNSTHQNTTSPLQNITTKEYLGTRFEWNEYEQNMILGSFFWGYVATELPGGRLAEVIGARRVFGYSILGASILTFLTPFSAHFSYLAVLFLRVLLGFLLGVTWPAMHPMAAKWIPPNERSSFMSNMMASSLGAAITLPVCGLLIDRLGWESVFYVTSIVGIAWSLLWFFVVYDTPAQHPRITASEREYIEKSLGTATHTKALNVPWRSVLTSAPVWAIVITHFSSVFSYFTVVNQLPTFMKYMLHFNIKENGLLSSLPYLGKYLMALGMGILADYLKSHGTLSTTAIRKIFTGFAVLVPAILMTFQIFFGLDRVSSIAIFTTSLTFNGAVTAGYLGNGLDIAPNFAGTIFGIANTFSSFGGFLSAYMVGVLTYQNQTYGQWQIVFGILACTYAVGALSFLVFGTAELQAWNSPKKAATKPDIELSAEEAQPLDAKIK